MIGKALLNLDQSTLHLDPDFDPAEAIRDNLSHLLTSGLKVSPAGIMAAAIEAKEFTSMLPKRGNRILDSLAEGEFSMRVKAPRRGAAAHRPPASGEPGHLGIIAATILGAAMMMRVPSESRVFGYPLIAMLFFTFAVLAGTALGFWIVLTDRKVAQAAGKPSGTAPERLGRDRAQLLQQRSGGLLEERVLRVAPTWTSATSVKPASQNAFTASTIRSRSGPHGIDSATSFGPHVLARRREPRGVGRSAFTFHPPANQRNCSCARVTAVFSSGSQQIGICPMALAPLGPIRAPVHGVPGLDQPGIGLDGDQMIRQRGEVLDGPVARDRHRELDGDVRYVPDPGRVDVEVVAPVGDQVAVCSARMISTASASISWRVSTPGQPSPTTCSLRFSPLPSPSVNGPRPAAAPSRPSARRRPVAHRRAGHVGHQVDPRGRVGDRAEHRPGVRRMPLLGQPGREVVAHHLEVEPGLLGPGREPHQVARPVLLGHQRVAEVGHRSSSSGP